MAVVDYFSHIQPTYSFDNVNTDDSHIYLILKALLHCRVFCTSINNCDEDNKVIVLFKKLIKDIKDSPNSTTIDCNGIIELINTIRNFDCVEFKHPMQISKEYKKYNKAMCMISRLLNESSIYKLFTLTRSIYGYCDYCKLAEESPVIHRDIIYYASGFEYEYFDLEDSLYAERYDTNYTCNKCGIKYNYKVAMTVKVPEILIVMAEYKNSSAVLNNKKIPETLTIPCSNTMTYIYKLSSYIERDKKYQVDYIILPKSDNSKPRFKADSNIEENINTTNTIIKHHFFYIKIASIYNYKKYTTL